VGLGAMRTRGAAPDGRGRDEAGSTIGGCLPQLENRNDATLAPVAPLGSTSEIVDALWPLLGRRVADRAGAAVELLDDLLHGFGRVHRHDHELRVGDRVLNDDREILPRVARASSLGLAITLGNRRIASCSVLDAGTAHEVGGYADAMLVDTVLRKRESFRGTIETHGRRYVVACRPLYPTTGHEGGPLGMLEAYQDVTGYRELIETALRQRLGGQGHSALDEQADRMDAITHFIDDVARRLQLLALNGNIIAAQAGDHGRAFRVVCRELSSLADQSKEAVGEVRRLTFEIGLASTQGDGPEDANDADGADGSAFHAGPSDEHAPTPVSEA
jgi:hypothetical protein